MKQIKKIFEKKISRREFIKKTLMLTMSLPAFYFGLKNLRLFEKEEKIDLKECMFYSSFGSFVKCELCPHGCTLQHNQTGICRVRTCKHGKLYTLAYGNPCAVHIDPIEKKPLYHFLPGSKAFSIATAGCNLRCLNCQNWTISQRSPLETKNYDLMPQQVVENALRYSCKSIAYTYSEPVVFYEYMYDTSKIAKEKGIKNVWITAGYINEYPLKKLCEVIDAANVDLKSFSNEIYKKLNGGTLKPVLRTLEILKEKKVWFEITNLVIPEWTDDLNMIREMVKYLVRKGFENYPLHFSRFFPMYKLSNLYPTPIEILKKARKIALEEGMKFVYIGNVPNIDAQNTYCPNCNKIIIKRKGYKILENNIINGKCKFCNYTIPGVWY